MLRPATTAFRQLDTLSVVPHIATSLGRPTRGAFSRAFNKLANNVLGPRKAQQHTSTKPRQTKQQPKAHRTAHKQLPARTTRAAPVAIATTIRNAGPRITGNLGSHGMTITHREFCFDINSNSSYTPVRIPIQPGSPEMTRWLANVAPWFESYTLHNLSFEYVPSISTGRDGRIIMGVDYDAMDDTPSDIHALENVGDNASGSIWAPLTLRCNPKNLHKMVKERYVRSVAQKTNQDLTTTDCGAFFLALDGASAAFDSTKLGAIYITYTITLRTPQVVASHTTNLSPYSYFGHAIVTTLGTASSGVNYLLHDGAGNFTPVANANPASRWGDGSFLDSNSLIPVALDNNGGSVKLPVGTWVFELSSQFNVVGAAGTPSSMVLQSVNGAGVATDVTPDLTWSDGAIPLAAGVYAHYQRTVFRISQTNVDNNTNNIRIKVFNPNTALANATGRFLLGIQPHLSISPNFAITPKYQEFSHLMAEYLANHSIDKTESRPEEKKGYFF